MNDVAVFDHHTAATVARHLTLMKPGDVVTEISEAISDPIASRRCKSNSIVMFAVSRCRRMLTPVQRTVPGHQSVLPRPPAAPRDSSSHFPLFDVNPNSGESAGSWQHPLHRQQPRVCRCGSAIACRDAGRAAGYPLL